VPLLLQQAQHLGAFETGLVLFPQALVMGLLMPISGRLYDRIGPRLPASVGLLILATGTYLLHNLTVDAPRAHVMGLLAFRAVGMGLAMMPIMTGGLAVIPPELVSRASAFNNVVQRSVAALGLAVLTVMLTSQRAHALQRLPPPGRRVHRTGRGLPCRAGGCVPARARRGLPRALTGIRADRYPHRR
jgi:MFS family permease